jgi:hypothetical protein
MAVGLEVEARQVRYHQFESFEWIRDEPSLAIDVTSFALVKSLSGHLVV